MHRSSRNSAAGLDSWSLCKFAVSADYRGAPSTPGLGDRSSVKDGKGDEVMRVVRKRERRERERIIKSKKRERELQMSRMGEPEIYRVTGTARGYCFPISRPLYRYSP